MVISRNIFLQRYFDGRPFRAALSAAVQRHERLVEPPRAACPSRFKPTASARRRRTSSIDLMCSLRQTLPSSPATSFSLLCRRVSLLYKTRTTPGLVQMNRAVHQGQPGIKRGLCLALVGALELLSAAYWSILILIPKLRIKILENRHYD